MNSERLPVFVLDYFHHVRPFCPLFNEEMWPMMRFIWCFQRNVSSLSSEICSAFAACKLFVKKKLINARKSPNYGIIKFRCEIEEFCFSWMNRKWVKMFRTFERIDLWKSDTHQGRNVVRFGTKTNGECWRKQVGCCSSRRVPRAANWQRWRSVNEPHPKGWHFLKLWAEEVASEEGYANHAWRRRQRKWDVATAPLSNIFESFDMRTDWK